MKAMILAAGIGTRLRPLTEHMPKALVEVQRVPLLEHAIRYLKFYGIEEIIINVHHFSGQIEEFLKKNRYFGMKIILSDEQEMLMDTGGGLVKAAWFFSDGKPLVLMASDVITDLDLITMYRYHLDHGPLVTLAVKHRESTREFLFDAGNRLCGWHNNITGETRWARETSDAHKIAFSTIHVIDPRIFSLVTESGPFSLIDLYLRIAGDHTILGYNHDDSVWFEFGRIENLVRLNRSSEIRTLFKRYHI